MMRTSVTLCLLALSLVLGCGGKSTGSDNPGTSAETPLKRETSATAQLVQADVRRTLNAVYEGDLDTVLKFTHPNIIEQMGGPTQARTTLQHTLKQVQAAGMKVDSLVFPVGPTFTSGSAHEFAVVPTKLVLSVKGQRLESLNYQLGVRELTQTNWTYIEGSRITGENVRTLFPDFPSGFEFPKVSRKRL